MTLKAEQTAAIKTAEQSIAHAEKAIDYAIRCGEHLVNVKAETPHGEFLPWIEEKMPIEYTQCKRYMKVFNNKEFLNRAREPFLEDYSIRGAIDAIKEEEARLRDEETILADKARAKEESEERARYRASPEYKAAEQKKDDDKARAEEIRKAQEESHAKARREKWKEEDARKTEKAFEDLFGVTLDKGDPYYKLGAIILTIGNEEMESKIFKVMKQYAHPDKGGDAEVFKAILKLEGELK